MVWALEIQQALNERAAKMNRNTVEVTFSGEELQTLEALASKLGIPLNRVIIQSLRQYELVCMGSHKLVEINPLPTKKVEG